MERDQFAAAGGYLLSILGAAVLGISIGIGHQAAAVNSRLACGTRPLEPTSAFNVTSACADILGSASDMVLASAGGGSVAFLCGLLVIGYTRGVGGEESD